ncbi:MAG: GH92 family glycosyl hydrolase, partial [Bacteroidales bacterium]|nr:GH92 family glycosyl hydrolase [Bacteroidales bacterium]
LASFKKETENARPGYYSVRLDNFSVDVELTTSLRTGMHRYKFDDKNDRNVMLNLSHVLQPSWGGRTVANSFEIINMNTVKGTRRSSGWARDHLVAYYIEFSEDFIRSLSIIDGKEKNADLLEGKDAVIYFSFAESDEPLLVKVAISPVDPEGARKNMISEIKHWDFDRVRIEAENEWERALSGIRIETGDKRIKTNFYTALYHTKMAPFIYQDVDGRYRGMNKEIIQAPEGYTNYTVFSLWDTFRAFHPLITITNPELAAVWSEALVQKYKEGGIMPKWPLASNYTGTMVGYPAVSVLADAIAKNLAPEDLSEWLEAAVMTASWRPDLYKSLGNSMASRIMPRNIYFKETLGWSPSDSTIKSVSYGLEMAYYDWCVARIAEAEGDSEIEDEFTKKSKAYKFYLDSETGLMRGKNYDGSMIEPFNPRYADHSEGDYVEGNAWQWSFFTPHAMEDIIKIYGSKGKYEAMLDTLFTTSSVLEGKSISGDITGLIGQYAHGNEPSHHMAYLYNWTEAPYKGQERLDQIMSEFYLPEPAGIIGNEDCGQMSAWYVLSALGIYQLCPGDPTYTTGRPIVDRAEIIVEGGLFEIIAHNNSPSNKYVKEIRLNGIRLNKPFFQHKDLVKGGILEFYMSDSYN